MKLGAKAKKERAAGCLKALAHPTRLAILMVLREGEKNVQQIIQSTDCSQPNVSQHLRLMRDKGILKTRRQANQIFYQAANKKIFQLLDAAAELFCKA